MGQTPCHGIRCTSCRDGLFCYPCCRYILLPMLPVRTLPLVLPLWGRSGVSTFSGVGSLDQVCSVVLDGELLKQFRVFGNFFAQQGDEIEARRALGITPPFGQGRVGWSSLGPQGF